MLGQNCSVLSPAQPQALIQLQAGQVLVSASVSPSVEGRCGSATPGCAQLCTVPGMGVWGEKGPEAMGAAWPWCWSTVGDSVVFVLLSPAHPVLHLGRIKVNTFSTCHKRSLTLN